MHLEQVGGVVSQFHRGILKTATHHHPSPLKACISATDWNFHPVPRLDAIPDSTGDASRSDPGTKFSCAWNCPCKVSASPWMPVSKEGVLNSNVGRVLEVAVAGGVVSARVAMTMRRSGGWWIILAVQRLSPRDDGWGSLAGNVPWEAETLGDDCKWSLSLQIPVKGSSRPACVPCCRAALSPLGTVLPGICRALCVPGWQPCAVGTGRRRRAAGDLHPPAACRHETGA